MQQLRHYSNPFVEEISPGRDDMQRLRAVSEGEKYVSTNEPEETPKCCLYGATSAKSQQDELGVRIQVCTERDRRDLRLGRANTNGNLPRRWTLQRNRRC